MSHTRELPMSRLLGRRVHDVHGKRVGRITELRAEIELRAEGSDYHVVEVLVGAYGWLEALAAGRFAQHFLRRLGRATSYRGYRIPWRVMNLADVRRPRLTCSRDELTPHEQP